jgi:hypothetical protein
MKIYQFTTIFTFDNDNLQQQMSSGNYPDRTIVELRTQQGDVDKK